jgi:hypothetical protein
VIDMPDDRTEHEAHSQVEIRKQISQLKTEIESQVANKDSSLLDLNLMLAQLQKAEDALRTNHQKAWYELVKAKLIYYQKDSCYFSGMTDFNPDHVRRDLCRAWHQVAEAQRNIQGISTVNAADWLNWAEIAIKKEPPNISHAMYCLLRSQASLAKAEEFILKKNRGFIAIGIEVFYLLLIPTIVIIYHMVTKIDYGKIMSDGNIETILHVPRYVFMWGFLGGFDPYYMAWYIAHPWVSAVLGGAVSLAISGGLNSLAKGGIDKDGPVITALLSLASFIAGFSTHQIWKRLDKMVSKSLGGEDEMHVSPVDPQKEIHKTMLEE